MALWKWLVSLTVIIAMLWETRPAYSFAYLGVILFFVLQHWQTKAANQLVVERQTSSGFYFPGDQGEISILITNYSHFPFAWISATDKIPHKLIVGRGQEKQVFSMSGRTTRKISFQLVARERGVYRLGSLELFAGDYFAISTQRLEVHDFHTIIVFPEVKNLATLSLPSKLSFGNFKALRHINPDPTRLAGVRPYEQGDPLRTLHWPATARAGSLQVKQFEHTVTTPCAIFLDLFKADYDVSKIHVDTELAVSTAASLAAYLIQSGEATGLFVNGVLNEYLPDNSGIPLGQGVVQIPIRQGNAQLTQILTILAGVTHQEQTTFLDLLQQHAWELNSGVVLLWIVPQDTKEIVHEALAQVRRGRQIHIFVVGDVIHKELLHKSASSALKVFAVHPRGVPSLE